MGKAPAKTEVDASANDASKTGDESRPVCGIVMPIADYDGRASAHWEAIKNILERAIESADLEAQPVWLGDSIDIIHERIVHNLYAHDVIIADVSALNPNVMFELGMRLTYGKPTILVADDETKLPFDTRMIDHEFYPRALTYHDIEAFIMRLSERVRAINAAAIDGNYKPFIARFGPRQVVKPGVEQVEPLQFFADRLDRLETTIKGLGERLHPRSPARLGATPSKWASNSPASGIKPSNQITSPSHTYGFDVPEGFGSLALAMVRSEPFVEEASDPRMISGKSMITVRLSDGLSISEQRDVISRISDILGPARPGR